MIEERDEGTKDTEGDESDAAQHDAGQEQEPKQAQEDSSTLWDTEQHSDAPGPFGTGSSATAGPKDDEAGEQDDAGGH
jgi:hypothetical protein